MKFNIKIFDDDNVRKRTIINVLILVMVISAIFGFIYETIFYRIDLGYFVKRGSTFRTMDSNLCIWRIIYKYICI